MTELSRIIDSLEASPASGAQAFAAARLGFLEWVVATPDPITARTAREALDTQAARSAHSPAARAFVECIEQVCTYAAIRPARRRARARGPAWVN